MRTVAPTTLHRRQIKRGNPNEKERAETRLVSRLKMSHLDDLPKREGNRRIQEQSESAFQMGISECGEFVVQSECRHDYGTDYFIEAGAAGSMTNVTVHVQLKGTARSKNSDGSVSLSINRKNLNYLAMQPGSIFVCYHTPSRRLLVRRVDDVFREYEHSCSRWTNQKTVTVKFKDEFDQGIQRTLKEFVFACAKAARDHRLHFATHPPENISSFLEEGAIDLPVPADQAQAERILVGLYDGGRDRTISRSFDKFRAILGTSNGKFMLAYMAEINLGINGRECNKSRIADGIEMIRKTVNDGLFSPGSLLYCVGNGWLALDDYEKARDAYNSALFLLDHINASDVAAQCYKNLGSAMEKLNKPEKACALYTQALELDPTLPEAHFALALWHIRNSTNLDRSLKHLDAIVWSANSAGTSPSVQGWRAEILFKQGKIDEAFRDIRTLMGDGDKLVWVWPWCIRLVAMYGRSAFDSAQASIQFWDAYLRIFPDDLFAQRERLLCVWFVHANGGQTECDYGGFIQAVADIVTSGVPNPAFLWDRAGHWAQDEEDWVEAEKCYRKAYELSPAEYGYCLGTALNFLGQYAEALPMLLLQAEKHQPDAMSWFQVAIAREGTGDVDGCITAYKRALQLDEDYDLAWFNLGSVYWNSQNPQAAISTWKKALRRFPTHQLSSKLQKDFPNLGT